MELEGTDSAAAAMLIAAEDAAPGIVKAPLVTPPPPPPATVRGGAGGTEMRERPELMVSALSREMDTMADAAPCARAARAPSASIMSWYTSVDESFSFCVAASSLVSFFERSFGFALGLLFRLRTLRTYMS